MTVHTNTFNVPAMRTDWFRAWAAKTRTDEEINLLYADGRATRRGFTFASALWRKHANLPPSSPYAFTANDPVDYSTPGTRAYALQKSSMFQHLANHCEKSVLDAHKIHRASMRKMEDDEAQDLKSVFHQSQEGLVLEDVRLDYSLVCASSF